MAAQGLLRSVVSMIFAAPLVFAGTLHAADEGFSGFLGGEADYGKLEEAKLASGYKAMRWLSPDLSLKNYPRALVETAVLYPEPEPGPQVSEETLLDIQDYLTQQVRGGVGKVLTLVDEPAAGAVRVEAAITGVLLETQGVQAYELVPIGAVFAGAKAAAGKRKQNVRVLVEVRLSDSLSGETLGMVVRTVKGEPLKGKKDELRLKDVQGNLDTAASDATDVIEESIRE